MAAGPASGREDTEHVLVRPVGEPMGRDREFTAFVLEHRATLLRAAWLLVGDAHRAEELAQQALERTYVAWPRARTGDPVAYARRVLVNLRTDTWRRRRREVLVEPVELVEHARAHHDPDRAGDRDRLVRALATLSERQRRIVVLRYLMDLSEAEVAADLGVSLGTVKSTASRALAELRAALGTRDGLEGASR
ncbi:MAG: SigE family RNA polymerase sigma factor [Actinomycetales bacterium]|nr:SigE family RNA polymerase sigma factor [Actinomycetales bacterium]